VSDILDGTLPEPCGGALFSFENTWLYGIGVGQEEVPGAWGTKGGSDGLALQQPLDRVDGARRAQTRKMLLIALSKILGRILPMRHAEDLDGQDEGYQPPIPVKGHASGWTKREQVMAGIRRPIEGHGVHIHRIERH
jgi:hypothetical protein